MDYSFTREQLAFKQEVHDFIMKELPRELLSGESEDFELSMGFRRKLGEKKWIGIGWPEEYGGLGASPIMQMLFHEEMVYNNGPLDPQAYQVGPALIHHANEDLRKTYLGATARQEVVWCQGFSEPNSGSDLASLQTTAVQDGDEFVINGQKIWTTWAHKADVIHILTRTDPDAPKHRGISYFVLDMKTPGIDVRPLINMADGHEFNEVYFTDVRVPRANMIGEENRGWYVAMTTLENERSGIRDVSRAHRHLTDVFEVLKEAKGVAGIRRDTLMTNKLADLALQVEVSRRLSYRVGWMQDQGIPVEREAPVAKLFGSELSQRITYAGMELMGLYGQVRLGSKRAYAHGLVPEGYMTSIPGTIAAGSSEINRNIIAARGLGLPRGY
ncbi:acyl-CoA dehydrogenase family protein [Dehalococcoidia bacterium]|nr:acyl-CoA dehydrogenase family protein [Dehalococcoidia bacterium]